MTVEAESSTRADSGGQSAAREVAKLERAYQQLKKDIMSEAYNPNERLVEAPLTRALGVSRNTLRTVLARLEHEGLVVLEPNRGGRVRAFSVQEAHDILRVREVLEGLVARLAAQHVTPAQCAHLREVVEGTGQAVTDDDVLRYGALNRQFHKLVTEMAGSPQAASALDSLHFPLVRFQLQVALVPGRKSENVVEHREVLRAIEAHDPDAAELAARQHIQRLRATLKRLAPAGTITAAR